MEFIQQPARLLILEEKPALALFVEGVDLARVGVAFSSNS
jgi:hypothetical protein